MKEATLRDAETLGQQLNLDKKEVWKHIQGLHYQTFAELGMAVHRAFDRDPGAHAPSPETALDHLDT